MFAEAPARSVAITEGKRGPSYAVKQKDRTLVDRGRNLRGCFLLDAAAVLATIPNVGCRPGGSSAIGSGVLHARQLLPVFFGDRDGQVASDRGQLAESTSDRVEADAHKRFAKVLPGGVELGPQLGGPAAAAVGSKLGRRLPAGGR